MSLSDGESPSAAARPSPCRGGVPREAEGVGVSTSPVSGSTVSPENPETPDNPEIPESPEPPEIPEAPEIPENPASPENPATPAYAVSEQRPWASCTKA